MTGARLQRDLLVSLATCNVTAQGNVVTILLLRFILAVSVTYIHLGGLDYGAIAGKIFTFTPETTQLKISINISYLSTMKCFRSNIKSFPRLDNINITIIDNDGEILLYSIAQMCILFILLQVII